MYTRKQFHQLLGYALVSLPEPEINVSEWVDMVHRRMHEARVEDEKTKPTWWNPKWRCPRLGPKEQEIYEEIMELLRKHGVKISKAFSLKK